MRWNAKPGFFHLCASRSTPGSRSTGAGARSVPVPSGRLPTRPRRPRDPRTASGGCRAPHHVPRRRVTGRTRVGPTGWLRPAGLSSRFIMESRVHNERCTPGSEGGARKPTGESQQGATQLETTRATHAAHLLQPRHVPCQRRRHGISTTITRPRTLDIRPTGRSRTLLATEARSTRRCEGGITPPEQAGRSRRPAMATRGHASPVGRESPPALYSVADARQAAGFPDSVFRALLRLGAGERHGRCFRTHPAESTRDSAACGMDSDRNRP